MRITKDREYAVVLFLVAGLLPAMLPFGYAQSTAPEFPSSGQSGISGSNSTALANSTDLESAKQRYLEAWNQTDFHVAFSTFIEGYSEQGYGVYVEHPSDVFNPGDTITLYLEPVGYSYTPVLNEAGDALYRVNLTAQVAIEDASGNLLATIENLPPFEVTSHHKNTELYMTVTVTQQEPFPEGTYKFTYKIGDGQTGETAVISKNVRVAETVSS
ncbi:MAG TPA: hypothetical protein VJP79_08025 [Nitrososphaera sp.]|nr:hypothetical protein [Nitrososphaera sp.]